MKSILGNKIILYAKLPFVIVFQWLLIMQMSNKKLYIIAKLFSQWQEFR